MDCSYCEAVRDTQRQPQNQNLYVCSSMSPSPRDKTDSVNTKVDELIIFAVSQGIFLTFNMTGGS